MDDEGPSALPAHAESAVKAVTSAYEAAAAMIEALDDPDKAYRMATNLGLVLRAATDANGKLRARLATKIWRLYELDLSALGRRLGVKKSRAGQFVQSDRAQRQEEDQ